MILITKLGYPPLRPRGSLLQLGDVAVVMPDFVRPGKQ
jgi:hypothetical protein